MTLDPLLLSPLLLCLALYGSGLRRLWKGGVGHGVNSLQAAAFLSGWLALALSLVWPLDAFAEWSLAAHMAQHMLLMAVAPPLLVAGLAGPAMLVALPANATRGLMRPLRRVMACRPARLLGTPPVAMLLQGAVMWCWHLPAAMDAAARSIPIHNSMHLSFLLAGVLFWESLLRSLRQPSGAGPGIIAIVGTMMQMGLLGALLTFAEQSRYPHYAGRAPQLGLTALEDQQLAGLIMWVPAAIPYLIGGLMLAGLWLNRMERQLHK